MTPTMPSPSDLKAFQQGKEAYARGAEKADNPHYENDDLNFMWTCGWVSAQCDAMKELALKEPYKPPYPYYMRYLLFFILAVLLVGCAHKPCTVIVEGNVSVLRHFEVVSTNDNKVVRTTNYVIGTIISGKVVELITFEGN